MSNLKILVVEDDPAILNMVEKRLVKAGYQVESAKSGIEAVELVSAHFFDVVITDLMMPGGVDGIDVLDATKAKWDQTEVILITAHATVDNAVEAMRKGAADYLEKPFNFEELLIRLQRLYTLKSLCKSASDLREAKEVIEKTAAQTIQNLEILVSELQHLNSTANRLLSDQDIEINERVRKAIEILSSPTSELPGTNEVT